MARIQCCYGCGVGSHILPLARELPYATGTATERRKKRKETLNPQSQASDSTGGISPTEAMKVLRLQQVDKTHPEVISAQLQPGLSYLLIFLPKKVKS